MNDLRGQIDDKPDDTVTEVADEAYYRIWPNLHSDYFPLEMTSRAFLVARNQRNLKT